MAKVAYEKTFGNLVLRVYEKCESGKVGYDVLTKDGDMIDFGYAENAEAAERFMGNFD